jgi:hypothetical protein
MAAGTGRKAGSFFGPFDGSLDDVPVPEGVDENVFAAAGVCPDQARSRGRRCPALTGDGP